MKCTSWHRSKAQGRAEYSKSCMDLKAGKGGSAKTCRIRITRVAGRRKEWGAGRAKLTVSCETIRVSHTGKAKITRGKKRVFTNKTLTQAQAWCNKQLKKR